METTYDEIRECINKKTSGSWNLLLGNGFSISFDSSFGAASNIENPKHKKKNSTAVGDDYEKEKELELKDLQYIRSYAKKLGMFAPSKQSNSANSLIEFFLSPLFALMRIVQSVHPENENAIRDSEAKKCVNFLTPFMEYGKVFSLNYDMLLLWAFVHAYEIQKTESEGLPPYKDGFTKDENGLLYWEKTEEQNIYYCHGALTLEAKGSDSFKRYYDERSLYPISRRLFSAGPDDLVLVSGSNSCEKLEKIKNSTYLMDCIDTLGHVKDNLVIIGVALDYETDSHIVDAIKKAYWADTKIYYGYYSPADKSLAEDLFNQEKMLNIHYFPTNELHIWR